MGDPVPIQTANVKQDEAKKQKCELFTVKVFTLNLV